VTKSGTKLTITARSTVLISIINTSAGKEKKRKEIEFRFSLKTAENYEVITIVFILTLIFLSDSRSCDLRLRSFYSDENEYIIGTRVFFFL
jgi:hypothetical protein